jgi:phospholipase C
VLTSGQTARKSSNRLHGLRFFGSPAKNWRRHVWYCFELTKLESSLGTIVPQVKNVVVVMFENRSLDNICGWLYDGSGQQPSLYRPSGSPQRFNGLDPTFWNPSNASYFSGQPPIQVPVVQGSTNYTTPDPDPEETFDNVTYQIYGPESPNPAPQWPMQGFVVNY